MTSPATVVLIFAYVGSIIGTASELTTDHDNEQTNKQTMNQYIDTRRTNHNLGSNNNNVKGVNGINVNNDNGFNNGLMINNRGLDQHRMYLRSVEESNLRYFDNKPQRGDFKRRVKRDTRCDYFSYDSGKILHPHDKNSSTYHKNINCVTVINATGNQVIQLTFVDIFRIEYHPKCEYDYLEIRDGIKGYSNLLAKVCGQAFPRTIISTGPNIWLKFHSDDTIEYEGFQINVEFKEAPSHSIPPSCYKEVGGTAGHINTAGINQLCLDGSADHPLDVLWTIETAPNTKIYLNFSDYALAKPNECEENFIEVYGAILEVNLRLAHYCGSMANSVTTKSGPTKDTNDDKGNLMHVRLYASTTAKSATVFNATYTAFRTVDPNIESDQCNADTEFDCDDNTCIDLLLKCDGYANCRLKTDEDREHCAGPAQSTLSEPHILSILVIFSLILSAMSFVFLFKCIKKLYEDHKIIKEHIRQSCEDRLDSLVGSRLTLDAKRLQRDSEPRASLERENHTNEMFKRKRDSFSKRKQPTSIDSDFIQETHIDLEEEPWRREVETVPEPDEVRAERTGRTRRSDMSKKEESIRSKRESEERKIRDASVGAPDTKESGCQTRESLFQADPAPSSDGSGTNSRGFSTFGYSGATIVRPSPPAHTNTSEITIELLKQVPKQDSKIQKKIPDRRPISTETTRSAPDVIIVSKPIR